MAELVRLRSIYANQADANGAARKLIEGRHAACARVSSVDSTFRWKGKVEVTTEWSLEAHAQADGVDACWDALLEDHPYETPCVEVLGPVMVPARYKAWAGRVTR